MYLDAFGIGHEHCYNVAHWGNNNILATGIMNKIYVIEFKEENDNPIPHTICRPSFRISALRWLEN